MVIALVGKPCADRLKAVHKAKQAHPLKIQPQIELFRYILLLSWITQHGARKRAPTWVIFTPK
jgi:hypothetical protein